MQFLKLDINNIGEDGVEALAYAMRDGAAPLLQTLNLCHNVYRISEYRAPRPGFRPDF